jgi:outer membrane receptor for ferrienterochelin and colicins
MHNLRQSAVRRRSARLFALGSIVASNMLLVSPRTADGQTITGTVVVRVTADSMPISGAAIAAGTANGATDRSGLATFTLPGGRRTLRVTSAGFLPESIAVNVGSGVNRVAIALHHQVALPEGLIAVRRDVRRGTDEPTQVDVTERDAVDPQLDRSPGSISDALTHIEGVRVQPLSAGSAGEGIRIRGMPARYTKVLMDGLPLFGATSQGAEVLQTPALGLQRVEVIKGVTSALYGTTALSGVVNMISAPPTSPSEVVVNGSTQEASDVALWQTHTFNPEWSGSLVAGRHYENPGDPDGDGWAEVAGYKRIVVRPRLYWARSEKSTWFMTGAWTSENRRSGTFGDERLPDFRRYRGVRMPARSAAFSSTRTCFSPFARR